MSDELELVLVVVFAEVIPAIVFLYSAYWAFTIGRALVGRIYRRQATWIGLLATALAVNVFLTYSNNLVVDDLINVSIALLFIIMFAYVDSVIPVIRRSDPLLRGILHWGTLRYFLWFDVTLLAAFNVLPGLFSPLASGIVGFLVQDVGWFTVATILFGVSGIALLVGVRRSGDMVLRSCFKWLGATLLIVIVEFVYDTAETAVLPNMSQFQFFYSYYALPSGAILIAVGYCLYKSVRALAPVGKIQGES